MKKLQLEKIIDSKKVHGKTYYLVQWQGQAVTESTFEPVEHLSDFSQQIKQFDLKQQQLKKKIKPIKKVSESVKKIQPIREKSKLRKQVIEIDNSDINSSSHEEKVQILFRVKIILNRFLKKNLASKMQIVQSRLSQKQHQVVSIKIMQIELKSLILKQGQKNKRNILVQGNMEQKQEWNNSSSILANFRCYKIRMSPNASRIL